MSLLNTILDRPKSEKREIENPEVLKKEVIYLKRKRDELYAQLRYAVSRLEALNSIADKIQYTLQELPLHQITKTCRTRLDQYEVELFNTLLDHGFSVFYSTNSVEKSIEAVQTQVESEKEFLNSYLENLKVLSTSNDYYKNMISCVEKQLNRLELITQVVVRKMKEMDD